MSEWMRNVQHVNFQLCIFEVKSIIVRRSYFGFIELFKFVVGAVAMMSSKQAAVTRKRKPLNPIISRFTHI